MNKEEKEEIIKNAFKLGELVGTYGNKKQIEIFEWFINDWYIKVETVDKLQKENNTLKTTITKQSKDISEQLKELDKKDKVISKMAEDRAEISEPKVSKEAIIDFYYKKVEEENE